MRVTLCSAITLIVLFLSQVYLFSYIDKKLLQENVLAFLLVFYLAPLILWIPGISLAVYSVKVEEVYPDEPLKTSIIRELKNLPSSLFIALIGGVFSLTVVLAPLMYLALASNRIGGYNGFEGLAEAMIRIKKHYPKIIALRQAPVIIIALIGYFALRFEVISSPISLALLSFLTFIIVLKTFLDTASDYLTYGLKKCVYCESDNPLEAVYCRECGLRLK